MKTPSRRKILIGSGSLIGLSGCAGNNVKETPSIERIEYYPERSRGDIFIKTKDKDTEKIQNSTVEYANYYEYYNHEKETEWKNETEIELVQGWQELDKSVLKEIAPKEEPVTFRLSAEDKEVVLDKDYYMFAYEKDGEVKITDSEVLTRKARNNSNKNWRNIEENFVSKTESNGKIKYKLVGHIPYATIEPDHPQKYDYIRKELSEVHIRQNTLKTFYPYIVTFSINKENKEDLQEVIESDTIMWKDFKKDAFINDEIGSIKYHQRKTFDTFANQIKEYTEKYREICGSYNTDQLDLRVLHGIFGTQVEYKRELPIDNGRYSVVFPFQLFDIQVADCAAQSFFMMGVAYELGYDVSTLIYEVDGKPVHAEPAALIEDYDIDGRKPFRNRDLITTYGTDADKHSSITVTEPVGETFPRTPRDSMWGINYLEAS
jgi:hypothetical protein